MEVEEYKSRASNLIKSIIKHYELYTLYSDRLSQIRKEYKLNKKEKIITKGN